MAEKDYVLFNNSEEFATYFGNTSYYKSVQDNICKIVKLIDPDYLLELGSGSGSTSMRIAKENPYTSIVAVDIRDQLVELSAEEKKKRKIKNLHFVVGDLTKLSSFNMKNAGVVLLSFAFERIADPLKNKSEFLADLYSKMQTGGFVIIGGMFLPEDIPGRGADQLLGEWWEFREREAYYSTFWNNFSSLEPADIETNIQRSRLCRNNVAGEKHIALHRKGLHLVKRSWLEKEAQAVGFKIIVSMKVNSLNDTILVLQK